MTVKADWNSAQYGRFLDERTRPALDLLAQVDVDGSGPLVDVGCGPGNSTAALLHRWPGAEVDAFDSSPEMLTTARASNAAVNWFQCEVQDWLPEKTYQLMFSNAVLHWVPEHEVLLPRLLGYLQSGGALAVQVPAHHDSALHRELVAASLDSPWAEETAGARAGLSPATPGFYYDVLSPECEHVNLWETCYFHRMNGPQDILEWVRGTALRPFLAALPDDEARTSFESELLQRLQSRFPAHADGSVLLPFKRLFFIAYR